MFSFYVYPKTRSWDWSFSQKFFNSELNCAQCECIEWLWKVNKLEALELTALKAPVIENSCSHYARKKFAFVSAFYMQRKSFPTNFLKRNFPVLKIKHFLVWCWVVDIPLATSMMRGSVCYWNIHKWINIFIRKQFSHSWWWKCICQQCFSDANTRRMHVNWSFVSVGIFINKNN